MQLIDVATVVPFDKKLSFNFKISYVFCLF